MYNGFKLKFNYKLLSLEMYFKWYPNRMIVHIVQDDSH